MRHSISRGLTFSLGTAALTPLPESAFGWPSADNTGPRDAVTLTDYSGPTTISTPNTIVEGKTIGEMITVTTSGVTFRDCLFTSNESWSIEGDLATDLTVEHCKFTGGDQCLLIQGTVRFCEFSGMRIAITLKGGTSTITNNYIHDLGSTDPEAHFDGIFISGGQTGCLIQDNSIEVPTTGGTSSIFIATRWAGADIVNTTVNHNRLLGTPSYAMYSEQTELATITGTVWTNNEVQAGAFGYFSITDNDVTMSGNVDAFTGVSIDAVNLEDLAAAFTPSSPLSSSDSNVDTSLRMVCTLSEDIAGPFRVAIKIPAAGTTEVSHLSAGVSNGSGNTVATPVEITCNGASGFSRSGDSIVLSDLVDLGPLSAGAAIVISIDYTSGNQALGTGNSNVTSYFKAGATYNQAAPGGLTASSGNNFGVYGVFH